jgi:hypothetical protein
MTTKAILTRTEEEKLRLAHETVDYLNELLALSPEAMDALMKHHVDCEAALADHPTVQAVAVQASQPAYVVGVLGIINGLIGEREGIGYVVAGFDDETGKLTRFMVTSHTQHAELKGKPLKPITKKTAAGWGWPGLSKKMHYFGADHRSLCGKWAYTGERVHVLDHTHALPDQCKVCFRKQHAAL